MMAKMESMYGIQLEKPDMGRKMNKILLLFCRL